MSLTEIEKKWQPIETAEKTDENMILVCEATKHDEAYEAFITIAFWCNGAYGDNEFGWCDWAGGLDSNEHNGHEEWCYVEPTHWMPLPEPPTNTSGGKGL